MGNAAHAKDNPMSDSNRDHELTQSEGELSREEAALGAEITKSLQLASQFDLKLKSVRSVLIEVGDVDQVLANRVGAMAVPPLETEAAFARARKVRAEAVAARRKANAAAREAVDAWQLQLSVLAKQLASDEKAAHALMQKAHEATLVAAPAPATEPELPAVQAAPPAMKKKGNAPTALKTQQVPAVTPPPPPANDAMPPRRHAQRVRMQAAVELDSDDNFFSGFSANISEGGLFIATVNTVPKGTQVDLSFSLPSGEKIEASGVVRWLREVDDKDPTTFPGIGVQFTKLDERAQAAIHSFIEHRDPMFYVD